jgi:hypothetical protein
LTQTVEPPNISWNDPAFDSVTLPVQPSVPATDRSNVSVRPESCTAPVFAEACRKIHTKVWPASGSTTACASSITARAAGVCDGPQAAVTTARAAASRTPGAERRTVATEYSRESCAVPSRRPASL